MTSLETAARIAEAALTYDAAEAGAIVRRLATPPSDRRWTSVITERGVVMASVSTRDPSVGHIDLLAVHPYAQGKGHGRELLDAAETWLRDNGVSQARFMGHPPCYGWPGIDVRYTAAACLAERAGYERYNVAWNMTADLSTDLSVEDDLVRLAAKGVTVHAGGHEKVAAFAERQWNRFWAWEAANASGLHYAERDGEILGFAAWGARPTWFGPMGTAPGAEGLGIGRVLLRLCLAEQRDAGQSHAQIGWVGPLRFYSRAVGARAERVFWLYRRELG
ncbi:GNAT family N-acetyltransferase [Nonomuraea sp. NPDC050556]|uniref:GNAT family N-acetyltransferase n=1 Tax=Nonomuraea sp. NPDC050556 TaxID=3364369 RepID=UPI0037A89437